MTDFTHAIALAAALVSSFNAELAGIVALSLGVSLSATMAAFVAGAPAGTMLAIFDLPGRKTLIVLSNALLGLPPVVVGLVIYLLLSRSGPLGFTGFLFTPMAMIMAQIMLTFPIAVALTHRAMEGLWLQYGDLLRMDGASKYRSIAELFVIGRGALLTVFLTALGRAISEVGAIVIVGGNIRGYTRTITTTIALETSKGDLGLALALGLILIFLSVAVSSASFWLHDLAERQRAQGTTA